MKATIYNPVTLASFLEYVNNQIDPIPPGKAQVHYIVLACCTRETFTQHLLLSASNQPAAAQSTLLNATIRALSTSQAVRIVFCDSPPVLEAYLTTLSPPTDSIIEAGNIVRSTLIILNPLSLHRGSTTYSAQGLSRTFAAAVEAADRASSNLVVAETLHSAPSPHSTIDEEEVTRLQDRETTECQQGEAQTPELVEVDTRRIAIAVADGDREEPEDPWEVAMPIVSSTTKTFATAGEKEKMTRTITAKSVAARWAHFKTLPSRKSTVPMKTGHQS